MQPAIAVAADPRMGDASSLAAALPGGPVARQGRSWKEGAGTAQPWRAPCGLTTAPLPRPRRAGRDARAPAAPAGNGVRGPHPHARHRRQAGGREGGGWDTVSPPHHKEIAFRPHPLPRRHPDGAHQTGQRSAAAAGATGSAGGAPAAGAAAGPARPCGRAPPFPTAAAATGAAATTAVAAAAAATAAAAAPRCRYSGAPRWPMTRPRSTPASSRACPRNAPLP